MIIKIKKKIKSKQSLIHNLLKYYFFLSISLFLILIFLILQTGYWNNYKKVFLDRVYKSSYNNYLRIPQIIPKAIYGFFIKIPEINININFSNQLILEEDRKNVLIKGDGMVYDFIEVPASINLEGNDHKIDLRIKGDRAIHFNEKDKTSYKIKIDDDKKIFGLNKFSLMKPRARNYIHEWIFHQLMQEGDLIALKYKFLNLKINGENKGLYVLEEGFDKILIERNKRRNGPIFSLKEEWNPIQNDKNGKDILFQVYNKKNWLSEKNVKLTLFANNLLKEFFNDNLDVEEVFDVKKWAWYFAASDINYYDHGTVLKSVKFYFNPLTAKFEPIPFDGHRIVVDFNENIIDWQKGSYRNSAPSFSSAISCKKNIQNCSNPLPFKFFFKKNGEINKFFFNQYKKNINKITSKKFLDKFFKKREKQISKINAKIYSDYFYVDNTYYFGPGLYYFNKNEIYNRANRLRLKLSSQSYNFLITQLDNRIKIKNWNIMEIEQLPDINLIIKKIYCRSVTSNEAIIFEVNELIDKRNQFIILDKKENDKISCDKALLVDKINKTQFFKQIDRLNSEYKSEKTLTKGNYLDYFYIDGSTLRLKKKVTKIDKSIVIPKNYIVKIVQNEQVILINNSFIISESSFHVDGGDSFLNLPIKIIGTKENRGGGIFIRNTTNDNYFQNVVFEYLQGDLSNTLFNKYIIYGAINIYNSNVKMNNFEIRNIFSEDAINIINSNFVIKNGFIDNIASDAIDVDNGEGNLSNLKILNIKNDAIDLSESNAKISNIYFNNIGDKAISAGENSDITIQDIEIEKSYLGLVSKDGSKVKATNITARNVSIPFAAYIKKNEYKYPELHVLNTNNLNYKILYAKDKQSKLSINKASKKKITTNIIDKIYNPEDKI